jgi:hypothetical protein
LSDIFNRQSDVFGGSFTADQARVTFPALAGGGSEAGLLMQSLQASYTQQLTRLYELSSSAVYYVAGRTAGQASAGRIIGPRKLSGAFYKTYGDVCNAKTNTLHFSMSGGCGNTSGARASFTAHFVVIQSVGFSVGAADMLINEQISMIFSSFLYS